MELNKNFVRDLLLFVESLGTPGASEKQLSDFCNEKGYSKEELIYTIQKLEEANFINSNISYASDRVYWFHINSITYDGHQFIDTIRDNKVWDHVKKESAKLKDVPLSVLTQLAIRYIENIFNL